MIRNNYIAPKEGVPFIDFWAMFYMLTVYLFTVVFGQANIIVFVIYFAFALPFYRHLDKFLAICFLLSTMSYYFVGADESLWSLYTILAVLAVVRSCTSTKVVLPVKSCIYFLWMAIAVVQSYMHSRFGYATGMYAMLYNIAIAMLVAMTVKISKDTLASFLPKLAALQLAAYAGLLLIGGHYDGYGYSISESINHNTFGASVAILGVIVFVKINFFKDASFFDLVYKAFWLLSAVLIVVSGSRNALMAMALTSAIVYIISQLQQGHTISGWLKFAVAACAILFIGSQVLPAVGVDLSRYDYIELADTGGSNRVIIWETLAPVIWRRYRWFGYGPSHYCSEQMILSLMNLEYRHTHNTLFEVWGELGLFGVVPFVLILLWAGRRSFSYIKNEKSYLMLSFMFVSFLLLSVGESFFAHISIWLVMGILIGSRNLPEDMGSNIVKQVSQR